MFFEFPGSNNLASTVVLLALVSGLLYIGLSAFPQFKVWVLPEGLCCWQSWQLLVAKVGMGIALC